MSVKQHRPSLTQYCLSSLRAGLCLISTISICILLTLTPRSSERMRAVLLRIWGQSLTWILGVKLIYEGQPPKAGVIIIANHTSYADIPILMGLKACSFLAKIEVSTWPIIGWGAKLAGTVFVDRSSSESRAASRAELKRRVEGGTTILVFSEGTTTPRGEIHPLKPGMFLEAESAQVPIQVVSLEYRDDDAAWVGDDPIWPNFVRVFGRLKTSARVCFRSELLTGQEGVVMAQEAEEWLKKEADLADQILRPSKIN